MISNPDTLPKISIYILVFNQEHKIRPAIESVLWADEVILVDSGSTDRTAQIAEELGVRVCQVPFTGFGALRKAAISHCTHDWIFSLDSDERMTPEAQKEILSILAQENSMDAYLVPRKNYFLGRWIRYSDWYPDYRQPQLFRKGSMTYSEDLVHETYSMNSGCRLGKFSSSIVQIPYYDLGEMISKMNRYSSLGAEKLISRGARKGSVLKGLVHGVWSFFRHYVLKRGFLDGGPGFVIALYNFESSFYKYLKIYDKIKKY
jgi:glycosyltransferase involved in cell wall biosynthesis